MKRSQIYAPLPFDPIRLIAVIGVGVGLGGCANVDEPLIPAPLGLTHSEAQAHNGPLGNEPGNQQPQMEVRSLPKPPSAKKPGGEAPPLPVVAEKADISLAFDQMPLPTFAQVVYGSILKKNFSIDPQIASRADLVSLRSGTPQTPTQVAATVRTVLRSYGVAAIETDNFVRIVPDTGPGALAAELRRGRSQPETPLPMRPIFYLAELQTARAIETGAMIRTIFGAKVQITEDSVRNALLISGQTADVSAALDALQVLDQPNMRSRIGARISPAYWSAEELSKKLIEILQNEGYSSGTVAAQGAVAINFVPVPSLNTVVVFALDQSVLDHVLAWSRELDHPASAKTSGFFTYAVKYADADDLSKTLQEVMSAAPAGGGKAAAKVVVNHATNSLIFQGGSEEYARLLSLLQELDKPSRSALIEVTVAEVQMGDNDALGIEWGLTATGNGTGGSIVGGTVGGLGTGASGLFVKALDSAGNVRAVLDALAHNRKAKVLSTPRIMARSGEAATISVGNEVPIITSQQSNANTNTNTGGVLQTVQYRSTGVLLNVKPVIHSGNRIDLDVTQEVSTASPTTTGVSASPTISTRKVTTRLATRDGSTVLLAGMITSNTTNEDTGVPLLKDIPLAGALFRNKTNSNDRTELVILITPYVINDDVDAETITDAVRSRMGAWALPMNGAKLTDKPRSSDETTSTKAGLQSETLAPQDPKLLDAKPQHDDDINPTVAAEPAGTAEKLPAPVPAQAPADTTNVAPAAAMAPSAPMGASKAQKLPDAPAGGAIVDDPAILQEIDLAKHKVPATNTDKNAAGGAK
ncbi:MAG: hypothetical protein JO142_10030 [Burkholderiales bacterium]|nr:hypothetical protein [Burkholderiales bacterium]